MKKFIVDTGKKKYIVEANDAEHAVEIVKKIDSVKDEAFVIEVYWRGAKISGEKRQWLVGKMATTDLNRADKFTSAQQAKEVIRFQNIGNHARVVRMSSIRDNENGTVTEKNLEDSMMNDAAINCNKFEMLAKESGANFHNISNTKRNGFTLMKFVSSAPEAEQERAVKWLRSVLEGQEGSEVLSWSMRGTSRGEMTVMIKDSTDASLSVYLYKSPIDTRQTIQIQKDGRHVYSFETAAEAITFANKILSIAAKLPK